MALTSFKQTMRSWLPGAGYDTSGLPRQGKELVVGTAAYTALTAGVAFTPAELGLTSIDFIAFRSVGDTVVAKSIVYDNANSLLFTHSVDASGGSGDEVTVPNNVAVTAQVFAIGDSSRDVELL